MEHPKDLRYTFEAVQKSFVNLGSVCTARVQSLKNRLYQLFEHCQASYNFFANTTVENRCLTII